ncbi:MAG: hypothetical protein ABJC33_06510, partial [Betaproteobacteria bacterium]
YRAAWDFLDLRCQSGELEGEQGELAQWWDRFANAGHAQREAMLKPDEAPRKKRRSRGRGRKERDAGLAGESGGVVPGDGADDPAL